MVAGDRTIVAVFDVSVDKWFIPNCKSLSALARAAAPDPWKGYFDVDQGLG